MPCWTGSTVRLRRATWDAPKSMAPAAAGPGATRGLGPSAPATGAGAPAASRRSADRKPVDLDTTAYGAVAQPTFDSQVGARLLDHGAGERQPVRLNDILFRRPAGQEPASLPVRCPVDPLELAQQGGPLFAGLDEAARPVHAQTLLDALALGGLRDRLKLAAPGQRVNLDPARRLDSVHPHEGLAHRLSDRHQAVIAQDQDSLVAEVARDAWSLADVRGWPLEVVVCDPAHPRQGFLTHRQQALSLRDHLGTNPLLGVLYPGHVGRRYVDGAVDHEPGGVRRIVRLAQEIAVLVQLDEGRRSDLVEEHPEWGEKKMVGAWD